MRHQYTPIFRELLTSSLWASASAPTRCVWMTLLLLADPEGYVPSSVPGLAHAANVTVGEARKALALLEGPDPDSRTKTDEGRRIRQVDHGWFILNFVSWRARAVHEAEKSRKRAWGKTRAGKSKPANDNGVAGDSPHVADCVGVCGSEDAPKPKPKPSLSSEGERSTPLPPGVFDAPVIPLVLHELPDDWSPSQELQLEAAALGITDFARRIAELRTGTIGGTRGVLPRKLDGYIRTMMGKWKTWAETDRAKAKRDAQAPRSGGFGGGGRGQPILEPSAKHVAFAAQHGLDAGEVVAKLLDEGVIDAVGLTRAREMIGEKLSLLARAKGAKRAV